jgi:dipeptidase E
MKLYLSSYKIGDEAETLKKFFSDNKTVGYIPNAFDFTGVDPQKKHSHIQMDIASLKDLGLDVQLIDLKEYFGKKDLLQKKLTTLGGIWVSGGNVFVLRQAMKLSDLDELLKEFSKRKDFVYGGYSAAGCVLSKTLDAYQIVDDATDTPYENMKETVWNGIGLIDFVFLPHVNSDHPESFDISKEVQYCIEHHLPYKTLRDGDVLIIE